MDDAPQSLRLLMLGTGPFAVPTFLRLLASEHRVAALVTRPPRPVHTHGRKGADVNPMRQVAEERGLPIHAPESINTDDARAEMIRYQPDLLVVCDYGQILSPASLAVARLGGINLHASLLPKYRGAAPINWAVYHGETETGVTVIHMTPQLDGGPCLAQAKTSIGPDETTPELEVRLAETGAELVLNTIAAFATDTAAAIPQDQRQSSKAPRLKKTDGQVDWTRPAAAIRNQIRAFQPWPGSYTHWQRPDGEPLRLILDHATVVPLATPASPGIVVEVGHGLLVIAAGQDALLLDHVQPSGKRILSTAEFLNGYNVRAGERFA